MRTHRYSNLPATLWNRTICNCGIVKFPHTLHSKRRGEKRCEACPHGILWEGLRAGIDGDCDWCQKCADQEAKETNYAPHDESLSAYQRNPTLR